MLFPRLLTYRFTLYYLTAIVMAALLLSGLGRISFSPMAILFSALVALISCYVVNWAFARAFGVDFNEDSAVISALILALIITPAAPGDLKATLFIIFASAWAMASKYLLVLERRHIFNPSAFGVALVGIGLNRPVSWWVGDYEILLPVIVLGGLLILARLRYFQMAASFAVVVLALSVVGGGWHDADTALRLMLLHSMFFFFGFVMLTEPRTAPLGLWRQLAYGALVGLLFAPTSHIGHYYFTPEIAILAGNLFSFLSNRRRIKRWVEAFA